MCVPKFSQVSKPIMDPALSWLLWKRNQLTREAHFAKLISSSYKLALLIRQDMCLVKHQLKSFSTHWAVERNGPGLLQNNWNQRTSQLHTRGITTVEVLFHCISAALAAVQTIVLSLPSILSTKSNKSIGVGRIFPRECHWRIFPQETIKIFPGGAKFYEISFFFSKIRKPPFVVKWIEKCQISKPSYPRPPSDAHEQKRDLGWTKVPYLTGLASANLKEWFRRFVPHIVRNNKQISTP